MSQHRASYAVAAPQRRRPARRRPPSAEAAGFPACKAVPMTAAALACHSEADFLMRLDAPPPALELERRVRQQSPAWRTDPVSGGLGLPGAKGCDNAPRRAAPPRPGKPCAGPTLRELDFDGAYRLYRLPADELLDGDDRRLEFWDGATETAVEVREPTSPYHERPSQLLCALAERIAAVRGKSIRCFGTMDLEYRAKDGRPGRILQADQTLYLHPERANIVGPAAMVVGENHYPDVVLEVDRTTDVRRHKLRLYEAWRLPEVWVDVPDESPRRRKPPGTTIYALAGGAFQIVPASRALPGWTASEIHAALNEARLSASTIAVLARIGRLLGEREGTGPDDDPMLRSLRQDAHAAGQAEAQAAGNAALAALRAGDLEQRCRLVRHLLRQRGLRAIAPFPRDVPGLAETALKDVVETATHCASEADFAVRLQPRRQP